MAAVVLESRADALGWSELVAVDSAGTGSWHEGERMDRRARAALTRRGYDGNAHRARGFDRSWLRDRDLLVALDHSHLHFLERARGASSEPEIDLLRAFDPAVTGTGRDLDVPDPYYGDAVEFDACLEMIEPAIDGLVDTLSRRLGAAAPPGR
jgi:protein-tyrosine phosphatase